MVEQVEVGIHWLTVTVHVGEGDAASLDAVRAWVASRFSGVTLWEDVPGVFRRFSRTQKLVGHDVYVHSDGITRSMDGVCSVDLRGGACEELGGLRCVELLAEADSREWWWGASRLDIAIDGACFSPEDVWEAIERGDVRTWAHVNEPDGSRLVVGGPREARTRTVYVGRPSSERMLRVYDRRGFTRVELQLRGDSARASSKALPHAELPVVAVGLVRSFIDFVNSRCLLHHRSAWPLLPWWAEWVDGIAKFRVAVYRPAPTFESTRRWVEDQLAPMLSAAFRATCRNGEPGWLMRLLLEDGPSRWGPRHEAIAGWRGDG